MKFSEKFSVKPGSKVNLKKIDPRGVIGVKDRDEAESLFSENIIRLAELQHLLYADNRYAVLIVFQAMDAGGKDGAIRRVLGPLNPQGCKVKPFKAPSSEELEHDYLWRIHKAVPPRGEIGVFNRSHYEDVLIVRVRNLVQESVWSKRYDQINDFEKILSENNIVILKFFLHISKDEQKERFMKRLEDPNRNWKATPEDFKERELWDDYQNAYEAALSKCSTSHAPWFIIPSDRKWFRNYAISQIIRDTLESMGLKYPKPSFDLSKVVIE